MGSALSTASDPVLHDPLRSLRESVLNKPQRSLGNALLSILEYEPCSGLNLLSMNRAFYSSLFDHLVYDIGMGFCKKLCNVSGGMFNASPYSVTVDRVFSTNGGHRIDVVLHARALGPCVVNSVYILEALHQLKGSETWRHSDYAFMVRARNSSRTIRIAKNFQHNYKSTIKASVIDEPVEVCVGDIIEISIPIISPLGVVDHQSFTWNPPITQRERDWLETKNHVANGRLTNSVSDEDVDRVAQKFENLAIASSFMELELQAGQQPWYDTGFFVKRYGLNVVPMQQLFDGHLTLKSAQYTRTLFIIGKCSYKVNILGLVKKSLEVFGFHVYAVDNASTVVVPVKRSGLIIDKITPVMIRKRDELLFAVSYGNYGDSS